MGDGAIGKRLCRPFWAFLLGVFCGGALCFTTCLWSFVPSELTISYDESEKSFKSWQKCFMQHFCDKEKHIFYR